MRGSRLIKKCIHLCRCQQWYYGALDFVKTMETTASKKKDWLRIAFILHALGPMHPEQIQFIFNQLWPTRSRSSREVAQIIICYQKKGFERLEDHKTSHRTLKIYAFNAQIPPISRNTIKRWEENINPFRGWDI